MTNILKMVLPGSLKQSYRRMMSDRVKRYWSKRNRNYPMYELETKHIHNLKPLTNRIELLKHLPPGGTAAELGVDRGDFSELILETNSPRKLHLIDCWDSTRYNKDLQNSVENKFAHYIEKDKVKIHIGLSTSVHDKFPDKYFDWIYIDTDHSYETTKMELELYKNKMKDTGIIAGHDFIVGNWSGMVKYGVIEAVFEFCVKNNWELIHITMDYNEIPSFAIRRMKQSVNSEQ
jgi:hypothetical protein